MGGSELGSSTEGRVSMEEGLGFWGQVCADWGSNIGIPRRPDTSASFMLPHTKSCCGEAGKDDNLRTQPSPPW